MELILPLPPSVNRIWRRVGNRTILSREARSYRKIVCAILEGKRIKTKPGPLAVDILFHPPDRRRRDIDNIQKALLDSLQHAGLYFDDSQIHRLCIERQELIPGGQVVVFVQPFVSTHSLEGRRQCLKCQGMFDSLGPAYRICPTCTALNAGLGTIPECFLAKERGIKRRNGEPIE